MVDTGDPHPFFSPWAVVVGLIARVTGLGPVDTLVLIAPVHLVLLLTGLWAFVRRVSQAPQAPFYALLFTLLLWGPQPWRYSGFVHLGSLGFVLPYPSTFAIAAVLWAIALFDRLLDRLPLAGLALVAPVVGLTLLSAVILLTHPF